MGYCAQGPGPVIKITGTKERRQSHNAVGTWLKKRERKYQLLAPKNGFKKKKNGHFSIVTKGA